MVVIHHALQAWTDYENVGLPRALILVGASGEAIHFLRRRIIRIFPLYWVATSVLLLMVLAGVALKQLKLSYVYVAASYLLIPWWRPGEPPSTHPLIDQGWTLSYEMFFYLFFALVICAGQLRRVHWLSIACFSVLVAVLNAVHSPAAVAETLANPLLIEFCFGCWLAKLTRSGRLPLQPGAGLSMTVGGIGLLAGATLAETHEAWRFLFWGLPALLIVAGSVRLQGTSRGHGGRLLELLGDASYSIYLFHGFVTLTAGKVFKTTEMTWAVGACAVLAIIVVSAVVGVVAHLWIERPLLQWLSKRARTRPPVAVAG